MPKHIDALSSNKKPTTETPTPTPPAAAPATPAEPVVSSPMPTAPASSAPVETASTEETATQPADTFETLFPEPTVAISGPPRWIWWTLLAVGIVGLAMVGYSLFRNHGDKWWSTASATPSASPTVSASATTTTTATPTATPSQSATATATPTSSTAGIDKTKTTIRVLNGTTKTGAAATAEGYLTKAGFTVRTIGNATHQDYQGTIIYYQAGHLPEAQSVQSALQGHYSITLEQSTLADPDMVLVVIGLT